MNREEMEYQRSEYVQAERGKIAHDLAMFRLRLLAEEGEIKAGKDNENWVSGLVGTYRECFDAYYKDLWEYENGS